MWTEHEHSHHEDTGTMPESGGALGDHWKITNDLAALREHVEGFATAAGLSRQRVDDLVLAANEAAINVLEHGGGEGTISLRLDATAVVVDVADRAGLLTPDHLPRSRPAQDSPRGYGLWVMHRLCDDVVIEQGPSCSHVRLRMSLPPQ